MPTLASVTFSDDPATLANAPYGSSPVRVGRSNTAFDTAGREGLVPLGAAKTVAALTSRRGVNFSPFRDTKYFLASDSILPLKDDPPPSIRAYPDPPSSDPVDIPLSTPSAGPSRDRTPAGGRSILKHRVHEIRLAAGVEEGTLNNKEAARLIVCGKRPRLTARDSFQLAMMQKAAGDGLDKGKGKVVDVPEDMPMPSSDDSSSPEELVPDQPGRDDSSEMEEEVEETGPLATVSLVSIILDGAEDLLTLEEAYTVLTTNLRPRIPIGIPETDMSAVVRDEMQLAMTPIRDEAPAMVRAIQRDLQRVLGKVPNSEISSSEADHTPFRGLMPLRDTTPTSKTRLTPGPTPTTTHRRLVSPDGQPSRKGYNEAEVRYRREAAGVGAAALRFLAFVVHVPVLFSCFSDVDITALLDQVMAILRTPSLPTPNPKRTYYNALTILAQMRVPSSCVQPVKEKIARALESALTEGLGGSPVQSPGAKDSTGQIRKESFIAVTNLFSTYPTLFFPHYAELLPACLRGLHSPSPLFRNRASAAVAALTSAKLNLIADTSSRETWIKTKATAQKLETFVVTHLKSAVRIPARAMLHANGGEKRTEWLELEKTFKETVGAADHVVWACATWATLVCLMGSAYATSGLAPAFDHIMDRSLQASTNVVRPLLARVAWSHAIYAYMSSGMATSLDDDNGTVIASYRPFPQSTTGDFSDRIRTIQLPVDLSMALASAPESATTIVKDGQLGWERVEKSKKTKWMLYTGLGAAAVVYAYSGTALFHQDLPAREITAVSGLPSSDGPQLSDIDKEEATNNRLDKAWERVVRPIIQTYGSLKAVDRLKLNGWLMLDAITSSPTLANVDSPQWSLERLLSTRYLDGEVFAVEKEKADKEKALADLLDALERAPVRANDIPSWGTSWIMRRLDDLLDLFQDMLSGLNGVADVSQIKWIRDEHANPIMPLSLLKIWSNLLRAIAGTSRESSSYPAALNSVTKHLIQIFMRDPATYVPISALNLDGTTRVDADTIRFTLFTSLLDSALNILGRDAIGATRFPRAHEDEVGAKIADMAFGGDSARQSTMAGCLLGQLLHTTALSFPLNQPATVAFSNVVGKLLNVGCVQGFSGKLLGDITNQMPFLFHDHEELQLIVWRQLALRWVEVIDLQPSTASTSSTNHTGALLVSLLSCPFREREITSVWHQHADTDDLAAWQALLEVTVLRFRAKRVGSNFGVLESLAGHLGDFLDASPKTSSTTITLSCLASAIHYLSFVKPQAKHAEHFSINENFVPTDFLALVSNALLDSYPSLESLASADQGDRQVSVSPAVVHLVSTIVQVVERLPVEFVWPVVSALKAGLAIWLQDEAQIVQERDFCATLDDAYIVLMTTLAQAIESGHLSSSAETIDELIDLFAPRLSRAQSVNVPRAFKEFWERSFTYVGAGSLSEPVRGFLEDVLTAVPGMIIVPGLSVKDSFSQEESQAKYPHAQSLASQPEECDIPSEDLVEAEECVATIGFASNDAEVADEIVEQYDADVSQSQSQVGPEVRELEPKHSAMVALSPIHSEGDLERSEERTSEILAESDAEKQPLQPADEDDVFGPTNAAIKPRRGKARKGKKRMARSRPLGDSESLPEAKRVKKAEVEADSSHSLPPPTTEPLVPTSSDQVEVTEDIETAVATHSPSAATQAQPSVVRNSHSGSSRSTEPFDVAGNSHVDLHRSSSGRPSLLDSARGWLAGVFKSPTTPVDTVVEQPPAKIIEEAQALGRTQSSPRRGLRCSANAAIVDASSASIETSTSEDPVDVNQSSQMSQVPTDSPAVGSPVSVASTAPKGPRRSRRRGGKNGVSATDAAPLVQDQLVELPVERLLSPAKRILAEEEDELLLSPETARKRRREEEGDIAVAATRRGSRITPASPIRSASPAGRRTRNRAKLSVAAVKDDVETSQGSSGRFDDAEETQRNVSTDEGDLCLPVPQIPSTPARRPSQQTKLLRMMEQASEATEVIEGLDLDGIIAFTRYLDRMKASAQTNLERRAIAEKAQRRRRM